MILVGIILGTLWHSLQKSLKDHQTKSEKIIKEGSEHFYQTGWNFTRLGQMVQLILERLLVALLTPKLYFEKVKHTVH